MNDGACDPQGRFWAGTLADDFRPAAVRSTASMAMDVSS